MPPRTFYRIIKEREASRADFVSLYELGRVPRTDDPAILRRWRGLSVFDSPDAARLMAARRPHLGRFLAVLVLPDSTEFLWERTGVTPGHYTVWGSAEALFSLVISTEPLIQT